MKRLLLDENLDRRLKNYFSDKFDVTSVPELGWQSKKNGELLRALAAEGITHLLTADRNLQFQQNLDSFDVVVVVLATHDIRLKNLSSHVRTIEAAIDGARLADKLVVVDLRKL